MSKGIKAEIHNYLFKYYDARSQPDSLREITQKHNQALNECVYNYPETTSDMTLVQWLSSKSDVFYNAAQWETLQKLWEKALLITNRSDSASLDSATCSNFIGQLYQSQGSYSDAEELDLSGVKIISTHVDTYKQLYYGETKPAYLELKQQFETTGIGTIATVLGRDFAVSKMGKTAGYRVKLQNNVEGLAILVTQQLKEYADYLLHDLWPPEAVRI